MIMGGLFLAILYYIGASIFVYAYGVVKAYEITGNVNFWIKDGLIAGVCKYPRWMLLRLFERK